MKNDKLLQHQLRRLNLIIHATIDGYNMNDHSRERFRRLSGLVNKAICNSLKRHVANL